MSVHQSQSASSNNQLARGRSHRSHAVLGTPERAALANASVPTAKEAEALDRAWAKEIAFLVGAGSVLARWLAVARLYGIYRAQRGVKTAKERRVENAMMSDFVERVVRETNISRASVYRFIERALALVKRLGSDKVDALLGTTMANAEHLLINVAKLPEDGAAATAVVHTYVRGKGARAAEKECKTSLHALTISRLHDAPTTGGVMGEGLRDVVLFGDVMERLRELPDNHVQCVVTSPPFYQQRDYGTRHWFGGSPSCEHDEAVVHGPFHAGAISQTIYAKRNADTSERGQNAITHSCSKCGGWYGQLGLEPNVTLFIEHLIEVFREVRRVLRQDGVCWIEIGDTFARAANDNDPETKNLLLIPQLLAIALQRDGWIIRSEIPWHKTTGLTEAVKDRPTRSHSTILQIVKAPTYYYDWVAVMEPTTGASKPRGTGITPKTAESGSGTHGNRSWYQATTKTMAMRNCRDVWSMPTGRFAGSHTATFPEALPERCVKASTSERGACAKCGAPWKRIPYQEMGDDAGGPVGKAPSATKYGQGSTSSGAAGYRQAVRAQGVECLPAPITIGWEPTCKCGTSRTTPCLVLDPFAGSGTTLQVAKQLGRSYVGVEINEADYGPLIKRRLASVPTVSKRSKSPSPKGRKSTGSMKRAA